VPTPNACLESLERRALFAALPPGFADTLVAGGLDHPVALDFAPDGRVFVTEQRGNVRVVKDGVALPTPFVHLDAAANGERGVDGIALDPDFAINGFVYVYYTAKTPHVHNRVVRFTADGDVAAAGSETAIFEVDNLDSGSYIHNGGALHFGADGKLYVATGENGNSGNAQSLDTTLGKLLRINPDGSIPTDNPFYGQTTGNDRAIWAMGLRNPFTFDIERGTGRTFINDVGEATWEEIDQATAGANFGWPREEGPGTDPRYVAPLYAYNHNRGAPTGCAITGGTFYDAPAGAAAAFPAEFAGDYFFADGCQPWVWRLDRDTGAASEFGAVADPAFGLSTGPDGSLYYAAYIPGELRKISFTEAGAPAIATPPADRSVAAGQPATFTVEAVGQQPLAFQWRRDNADIPGATQSTYTLPAAAAEDSGATFRVVVTNTLGSATSTAATLSVVTDAPPTATILTPKEGRLYRAGQALRFRGTATDAEDGRLPAGAFSWRIDFHHDEHLHPFMPDTPGRRGGSVRIPREGETSANVWYRVHLTVTDSAGLSSTTFRDLHPRTATITVGAGTPGLTVNLDGQPVTTPFSFVGVVGLRRTLEAPPTQVIDGVTYTFKSWAKRRRPALEIATPASDRTFTATYAAGGAAAAAGISR
jgi:glucose/arabinose dehydrogenase